MRQKLGEMLIEAGAIDHMQLKSALADQRRWGRPLGRTLVEMRLIKEEELVRVLAKQLGLQAVDLDRLEIMPQVIGLVPAHVARQYNVLPFAQPMKFLDVAMLDPMNLGIIDELRIRTQLNVRAYLAGPKMIERNIERYYGVIKRSGGDVEIPLEGHVRPSSDEISIQSLDVNVPRVPTRTTPPPIAQGDGLVPSGRPHRATQAPPPAPAMTGPAIGISSRDREIDALQERISMLEAVVHRDEQVLRKLLALLIEKGIATREEIIERLG